jgi:TRAP-type C4-dicarboxylate transport system permease small subunit
MALTNNPPLLERLDVWLEKTLFYAAAFMLIIIAVSVFYAVTLRYVFNEPPLWADEAPRVFFLWMTYIGIAVATKRGQNIRVTHFIDKIAPKPRAIIETFMHVLVLIMLAALIWYNFPVLKLQSGGVMLSTQWSYLWPFAALTVGSVLMFFYQARLMIGTIRNYRQVTAENQ